MLITSYRHLDAEALVAAVRSLEALAHERTVARLKQEADEVFPANGNPPHADQSYTLPYDPATVFLLEIMVSIACQTQQHLEDIW